ncbi:hypothetical protein LXL04_008286 [Taraxacum kok-saghyz]
MAKFEQMNQSKKTPISSYEQSRSAFIDLIILIASRFKTGLFELPRDYHWELESELKKIAPLMVVWFWISEQGVGVPSIEWRLLVRRGILEEE